MSFEQGHFISRLFSLSLSLSLTVRTFVCPYCRDNGLDELDLRDHCNDRHANDSRRVVCPVCVATPHGDPQYYSRDFVAHLNLRHCYYMDDITNLHQTDEMNLQCAILASYMKNV
ncbi:E3 ubiquitin-protein ligase RNF166-like [Rhinichthys klamathensis goyatoka]|uniref:E3 ubiquitin-protein ligase RNF166-like n=1 Tax=Rhinichthys klamathensis goyatoka TaxID=3034132 RepID=UPI0024B4BE6A|nr:E3 ubiquitin-protein ligase RNF166-like [Rhinichthys klamathensis goyatoka]